jgi:hypothetical protein
MDPGKNVRAVLLAMRTSGKYGRSAARNAIRAS